jgi:hypothetical protein
MCFPGLLQQSGRRLNSRPGSEVRVWQKTQSLATGTSCVALDTCHSRATSERQERNSCRSCQAIRITGNGETRTQTLCPACAATVMCACYAGLLTRTSSTVLRSATCKRTFRTANWFARDYETGSRQYRGLSSNHGTQISLIPSDICQINRV